MTSVVGICNLALTRIGAQTINSLDEASSAARSCTALYEPTRDTMLRARPWRFARRRAVLAVLSLEDSEKPTEWRHVYALPSDCLTALYVEPASGGAVEYLRGCQRDYDYLRVADATPPFEVRADRQFMTDEEEAVLIYTARIDDPTRFDPLFVEALSWRLGADLATALKGDARRRQEALAEAQAAINTAAATDQNEATLRQMSDADWITARL